MYRRSAVLTIATLGVVSLAPSLSAQGRGMAASPRSGIAQAFLAHTGDLGLTDQQVVRLAAIARRSYERDRAARAAMDSARALRLRQQRDSVRAPAMRFDRAAVERARAARQTDLRDALAVLTPDQQALAWQRIAPNRGRDARAGRDGARRGRSMFNGMRARGNAGGVRGVRGLRGGRAGRAMPSDTVAPRGRRAGQPQTLAPSRRPPV